LEVEQQLSLDLGEKKSLETEKTQAELEFEELRLLSEERKNAEHLRGKDVETFTEWQKEALAHTRHLVEHKRLRAEQTEITLRLSQREGEEGQLTRRSPHWGK
jgi:thymidylate synthase